MRRNDNGTVYVNEPMKRRISKLVFRWIRRFLLLLLIGAGFYVYNAYVHLNLIMTGPSTAARDQMALSLFADGRTAWLPGQFMTSEEIAGLSSVSNMQPDEQAPSRMNIPIDYSAYKGKLQDEWTDWPDGIRIEKIGGETFEAFAMFIRDPSRVYLGLSNEKLYSSLPGKRINEAMEEQGAVAAINSGAFFDNGTSDLKVGATPQGLVISNGICAWEKGTPPSSGFAGFDKDNTLVVLDTNIKREQAEELNIRDGCCFGPALIIDGKKQEFSYRQRQGNNPRTAIGQRADGTVIFLCIDGRQASSVGGTIQDVADLMERLGAVNACNMDGGSSTVMMYRDTTGKYGTSGEMYMVNSYSQLQAQPRRMPDYWMVRSVKED